MTILGVDPGKGGAACLLHEGVPTLWDTPVMSDGKKNQYDLPTMDALVRKIKLLHPDVQAVIEQVNAMPGQGVTSMFSMGYGLGLWHSLFVAHGVPFTRIRPQVWKQSFDLGGKDKGASILRARELFPTSAITLKKHDGRAEALLMAEYFRRSQRVPL